MMYLKVFQEAQPVTAAGTWNISSHGGIFLHFSVIKGVESV
jgi:hypothetical protein